jgi:hypothetical protein
MLTVLVATLIRDEEEWQRQAAMPATIARVILEQQHQEQGEDITSIFNNNDSDRNV